MRHSCCLLLVPVALAGGVSCSQTTTSLLVSLSFDERVQPAGLHATISAPSGTLRWNAPVTAEGRNVRNGDQFVVLLPDSADGQLIGVAVASEGIEPPLVGSGSSRAVLHTTVALSITLTPSGALADGGAIPDLATDITDGGAPDLGLVDQAGADLSCVPGTRTCVAGKETACLNNGTLSTTTCAFGCAGDACLQPRSCQSPGDISAGGTFADSSGGYADNTAGSCGGGGGVEVVTSLTTGDWRTVYLTTAGSTYDTLLYSRLTCADPNSELPLSGPCPGALDVPGASLCSDNGVFPTGPMLGNPIPMGGSALTLCSLPPGVPIYTILDAKGAGRMGGPYALDVTLAPRSSSLNSCAEAGNLLDGNQRSFMASTSGHANAFTSTASCQPGDSGAGAPDAVFFVTLTAARALTISTRSNFAHVVYVRRSPCNTADLGCAASMGDQATLTTAKLAAGMYFVIVDGQGAGGNATGGDFTISVH